MKKNNSPPARTRWIKIIQRDSPHSPQKDVRNTRWKLFFFTAFHRISYENSPCLLWIHPAELFLSESALQLIFLSNQASSDSSLQTISISNNFLLFNNFYSFFKIIQEFQTKPLVLINFTFEPLRNNASAVFLFSKTERINQSINYQIEQNSKSAIQISTIRSLNKLQNEKIKKRQYTAKRQTPNQNSKI